MSDHIIFNADDETDRARAFSIMRYWIRKGRFENKPMPEPVLIEEFFAMDYRPQVQQTVIKIAQSTITDLDTGETYPTYVVQEITRTRDLDDDRKTQTHLPLP